MPSKLNKYAPRNLRVYVGAHPFGWESSIRRVRCGREGGGGSLRCSHVRWLLVGGRERDGGPPAHGCGLCPSGVHLCRCAQRASAKVFPTAVRHANCSFAWRVLCPDVDLVRGRCRAAQPVGSPLRICPEVASPASRSLVLTRACDQTQGHVQAPLPPRTVLSF